MSVGSAGRTLELFFIDGKPDGMLTAEVFNWTGHILMVPRTRIAAALARKEARHAGAYILVGEKEGKLAAYIGEGDDVSLRIKSHETQRDWWTTVVFITTGSNSLNKAHVQYLESRLIRIAKEVGTAELDNRNVPELPTLSEAAIANMEGYLEYLLMVLPALRIEIFVEKSFKAISGTTSKINSSPRFELESAKHGIKATARLENGEFIVEAKSTARKNWEGKEIGVATYRQLYLDLVDAEKIKVIGELRVFTENYAFSSPSAAAAVVLGRSANGQTEWKLVGTTTTYKEWEAEQIAKTEGFDL